MHNYPPHPSLFISRISRQDKTRQPFTPHRLDLDRHLSSNNEPACMRQVRTRQKRKSRSRHAGCWESAHDIRGLTCVVVDVVEVEQEKKMKKNGSQNLTFVLGVSICCTGVAGYRSPCLSHAKGALYHLSYYPEINFTKRSISSEFDLHTNFSH